MSLKYFKRIFILVIIILVIAGIYIIYIKDIGKVKASGSKNKEMKISKEIAIGITGFDTINPILTKNLEIQHLTKLVYEPLINITQDFNAQPGIAEEWSKINELTYIIKINEGKKWQNGEKVEVEDIEYTIKAINASDSIYKENIKQIENIEKINDSTFKIYLKEPVNFFEYLLCFPIIEETTYNSVIPTGTGKYKISNVNSDEFIIQSEDMKIIVKICNNTTDLYNKFSRGEIDLIVTENTDYEKYIGNIGIEENIIAGREFYYISCENIENKEVRKTLNSNIKKEKLVYDLYNNRYIVADFPLEYGSYLNKEKGELQETEVKIKTAFTISSSKEDREIAEKIKEQLEEKNIKVSVLNYQTTNADLILKTETVPITPQIMQYFNNEQTKGEIKKVIQIEDKEVLKEEYGKIIDEYYEELPFISLYFNSYIVLHTNKLKGDFSGNWYNLFYNIDTWYKII